jgi:hypothetical protein
MTELNDHEFEVPPKLKERYNIKRIAKQGATILIQMELKLHADVWVMEIRGFSRPMTKI